MQVMKRPVTLVVSVLVTAAFLAGCSSAPAKKAATSTTTTTQATTTTTGAPSTS
jgi:PBP1b-binding outer membrane lipoprotein LpoB